MDENQHTSGLILVLDVRDKAIEVLIVEGDITSRLKMNYSCLIRYTKYQELL